MNATRNFQRQFLDYGSVYHQPIGREHPELIHQTMVALTRRYVSQFYCFNCDTYLQVKSGIGVLLVSHTAETADVQEFAMNRLIHIRPNIYFAVVSTTQKLEYDLYAESSYSLHITDFPSQYEFLAVLPRIEIQKFWATTTASAPRTTVSMVSGTISSS